MPIDAKAGDRQEFSYALSKVQPQAASAAPKTAPPKSGSSSSTKNRAKASETTPEETDEKPKRKTRVELLD